MFGYSIGGCGTADNLPQCRAALPHSRPEFTVAAYMKHMCHTRTVCGMHLREEAEVKNDQEKDRFLAALRGLTDTLGEAIRTPDGQWTVKDSSTCIAAYTPYHRKITVVDASGRTRALTGLAEFVGYRGGDPTKVVPKARRQRRRG